MPVPRFRIRTLMIAVGVVGLMCAFPRVTTAFAALLGIVVAYFALVTLGLAPMILTILLFRPHGRRSSTRKFPGPH